MHRKNDRSGNAQNESWMRLHCYMTGALTLAAAVLELIMAFALNRIEGFVSAEPVPYIIKYLITPVTINCVLVLVGMLAMKSRWLSRQTRQTMVSLCMAGVCLVLYGVHSLFPALILLPVVAIMLTTSYGDYRLTSITAVVCLLGVPVVDLLVVWDSTQRRRLENTENQINWLLSIVMLLGCYLLCLASIYYERQRIQQAAQQEWELRRDGLTGLLNRTALNDRLGQLCAGGQGVLVMVDLDGFKQLNDTMGHLKGDACLQRRRFCAAVPGRRLPSDTAAMSSVWCSMRRSCGASCRHASRLAAVWRRWRIFHPVGWAPASAWRNTARV